MTGSWDEEVEARSDGGDCGKRWECFIRFVGRSESKEVTVI